MKTLQIWMWIGMVVCGMSFIMGSAVAETFVQDGAGFWWDFAADGGVVDGRGPAAPEDAVDAFDHAARLIVDGTYFPDTTQALTLSDRMLVSGPETMSGLSVTRRAYVSDASGANWCCFMEYLENSSGSAIAVNITIQGNLGSDGGTQVTASSSGDLAWTAEDQWIASSDGSNGATDPSLSFNYWGAGAAISPEAVLLPASQEDYYCDFGMISVPAGETVILMHFISQNADDAAALVTATSLDGLPSESLVGLEAAFFGPVVNWEIASGLDVTPASLRTFSGMQGGSFTPVSYTYTLTGSETTAIDWTATGPAWVDIVPASGLLPISGTADVTVTINSNANSLLPGPHVGMITFTNTTESSTTLRALRVDVSERLVVTDEGSYDASGYLGGPFSPASRTYTLLNSGDTPLQWSTSVPAWLEVTPADYVADGGELASLAETTITVTPSAAATALTVGEYTDALTINNDSFGSAQTRDVSLLVRQQLQVACVEAGEPAIARGLAGGPFNPTEFSFSIANASLDGPVNWQINPASIPTWLEFAVSSGTLAAGETAVAAGTFTVAAEGLTVGDYSATLEFENTSYSSTVSYDVMLRIKDIVYVDAAVTGGDGLSWATAFGTVQEGIDLAATGDAFVWVANGVYTERITLAQGVEVYGGFTSGAVAFSERSVLDNGTIIDGDAGGRVVTFGAIGLAGISGCTIQNGSGDVDGGGGVRMDGSADTCFIDQCIIRENSTLHRGAGVYCLNSAAPRIAYSQIVNNVQDASDRDFGGGVCCYQSNPTIYRCEIIDNVGRYGAGIGCIESSPQIEGCIFAGNMAAYDVINPDNGHPHGSGGGAIFTHDNSNPQIVNCIIAGNVARNWSGGALLCQGSMPVVANCTVSRNYSFHTDGSTLYCGFVANSGSQVTLLNSIIEGMSNTAAYEEDPRVDVTNDNSNIVPEYCLFTGNPDGDLRDYDTLTTYTGGDNLNASVNGAHDNVAGSPDPQYVSILTGVWSAAPVYDPVAHTTTLTTTGDPFLGLDLTGLYLNADTGQWRQTLIVGNDDNTVTVRGDITSDTGVYGYADISNDFAVYDYHVADISPCISVGLHDPDQTPYEDLDLVVRGDDVCIGAFENDTPTVAEILSITCTQGDVANTSTITFEIIFSRAVTGLTTDDFSLLLGGDHTGAVILSVTGSDYRWIVTIQTGTGNGSITLVFNDADDSITDELGLNDIPDYSGDSDVYMDFLEITTHPQDADCDIGANVLFEVAAQNGTGGLHYTWRKDGIDLGASDESQLLLTNLQESDSGLYTCDVSDDYTMVTSNAAELQVTAQVPVSTALLLLLTASIMTLTGVQVLRQRKHGYSA